MRLTIHLFKECLKNPKVHFRTLSNVEVVSDHSNNPNLWRTTHYAESEIRVDSQRYFLCMPLSEEAHVRSLRKIALINRLNSPSITECSILVDEMLFMDRKGEERSADLLIHKVPDGDTLHNAIDHLSRQKLLSAVDLLEREFRRIGIVHNNLTPHNIIVGENYELIPIRFADVEYESEDCNCGEEFAALRKWIDSSLENNEMEVLEGCCCKLPEWMFSSYKHVSNPFEERVCVADERGYFYVNCQNELIIDTRFKWGGDFHEGRAEVETESGMGLIDKDGNFVIPAIYKIVDYDVKSGFSRVRKGNEWGLFNYIGEQILPFESRYIDDEDIEILSI